MPRQLKDFTCTVCGTGFTALDPRAKYCSNKCKQAAKYQRKPREGVEIQCRRCGVTVLTEDRRVKYCSDECRTMLNLFG